MTEQTIRRHALNFTERMAVAEFLKSVIVTDEGGYSHYTKNWSDTAVAKRMKCTSGNVQGVRRQLYPNFIDKYKVPKSAPAEPKGDLLSDLKAQVADLDSRVKFLEEELLARLKYLEDGLGVTPPSKAK